MIGAILAGGRATRLGGVDKGLMQIGGRPILARIVSNLRPQCDGLVLNANGDPARFAKFGLPTVADSIEGFQGPMAGILACLDWAAARYPGASHVLVAPADTPFLPADLATRLDGKRRDASAVVVCASSGGARHPVVSLWSVALRDDLRRALTEDGLRKVGLFLERHAVSIVDWPVVPHDPFLNVNTAADLAYADMIAEAAPPSPNTNDFE